MPISTVGAQNASGYTSPSVNQITGNSNGYSGTLSASGGGWQANNGNTPDRFVYWGINTDSDDDTQALCAFDGNLANGKMDAFGEDKTHNKHSGVIGVMTSTQTQAVKELVTPLRLVLVLPPVLPIMATLFICLVTFHK